MKFISARNVVKNIYKYLNYIDEYLDSIGGERSQLKDSTECFICTCVILLLLASITLSHLLPTVSELSSAFVGYAEFIMVFSFVILECHVVICLLVIRLSLIHI